jgi:hypothetical protein
MEVSASLPTLLFAGHGLGSQLPPESGPFAAPCAHAGGCATQAGSSDHVHRGRESYSTDAECDARAGPHSPGSIKIGQCTEHDCRSCLSRSARSVAHAITFCPASWHDAFIINLLSGWTVKLDTTGSKLPSWSLMIPDLQVGAHAPHACMLACLRPRAPRCDTVPSHGRRCFSPQAAILRTKEATGVDLDAARALADNPPNSTALVRAPSASDGGPAR